MFIGNYPKFNEGRILKSGMLESLRDYPREIMKIKYGKCSDGIIAGCDIEVMDNFIVVKEGIIKFGKNIYILKKDYPIKYANNNVLTSLKVKFLPEHDEGDYVRIEAEIFMTEDITIKDGEMELCRFKLREGARLRREYVNFIDFSTEFDTVNIINAPFAAIGESSLSPYILRTFGREMLKYDLTESFDINFACLCVQSRDTIEKDIIVSYIKSKLNITDGEYTNEQLYNYLVQILESVSNGQGSQGTRSKGRYKKIFID